MILVTGGAGFIGSNFVLDWLRSCDEPDVTLDALTYAGTLENLASLKGDGIGKLGQATHPEVVAARKKVAAAALRHGKYPAVASLYGQKEEVVAEGTRVFTLGADVLELGNAFKKLVSDFGGATGASQGDSIYRSK